MSYYHYFKLKENDPYTKFDKSSIKGKLSPNSMFIGNNKGLIKATVIKFYYDEETSLDAKWTKLWFLVQAFQTQISHDLPYIWIEEMLNDEDGELVRNRPEDEYSMQETIDNFKDYRDDLVSDLLILSCIRFELDEIHSDAPKTTKEYLSTELMNEIEEKLEYFKEQCIDYEFAKFCLEHCDRQTEDEKYKD